MKNKITFIVFIALLVGIFPFFSTISADNNISVDVRMLGGEQLTYMDAPKIVAGVWHYINFTVSNQWDELTLKMFKGGALPTGEKNESNYYEWKYDENSLDKWNDLSGYTVGYINTESCSKINNIYSFCIGIKDTFPSDLFYRENWTIGLYSGSNELYSSEIYAEKPTIGMSKPHGDLIRFYADPFTEMEAQGDDYFKFQNTGNLPLQVGFNYGKNDDILEVTGENDIIPPDGSSIHYLTLFSKSWPPSKTPEEIYGNGQIPEYYIISTDAFVELPQAPEFVISLLFYVGHSNYELDEGILGTDISFQYKKTLKMDEGDIEDLYVYISGNKDVKIDIWTEDTQNISILEIKSEDSVVDTPITISSTSTKEHKMTVKVEALREGKTGIINYKLEIDGKIQMYQTEITIGPPSQPGEGETAITTNTIMIIIVILSIILVVIYMIRSHFKYRRR